MCKQLLTVGQYISICIIKFRLNKIKYISSLIAFVAAFVACGAVNSNALDHKKTIPANAYGQVVDESYFGLHIIQVFRKPEIYHWPPVKFGIWRLILPEFHWFNLEPTKGEWRFEELDRAVNMAQAHGVDTMLTLGYPPAWASSRPNIKGPYVFGELGGPRDIRDWRKYVNTVATRYQGRIKYYEIWNEPQLTEVDGEAKALFTGEQLAELTKVAHQEILSVDPNAKIVSPSMVGGDQGVKRLKSFLAAGGGQWVDIIGFHFYAWPEEIIPMISKVRKVMAMYKVKNKQLWNTEMGFLIADPDLQSNYPLGGGSLGRVLDENEASAYVVRSLILGASAGLERFFWFGWDVRNASLVRGSDGTMKLPAKAYEATTKLLIGSRLSNCTPTGGVWSCDIKFANGKYGRLLWVEKETQAGLKECPTDKEWKSYQTLFTEPVKTYKNCQVPVTGMPIILNS